MATELNTDREARLQRLRDACDAFIEDMRKELAYDEYPKWVDGQIVKGPEDEAKLRAGAEPLQQAPEAEARPAGKHTR